MKALFITGVTMALLSMNAVAGVDETENFSFDVNAGARVSVENINGDIKVVGSSGKVVGSSGKQVLVVAHKTAGKQEYLDELEIVVDASEDYVRIETRHPDSSGGWFNWGNDSNGSVSYELLVPSDVDLDSIETVNGDITIESVDAEVKAATVNGPRGS